MKPKKVKQRQCLKCAKFLSAAGKCSMCNYDNSPKPEEKKKKVEIKELQIKLPLLKFSGFKALKSAGTFSRANDEIQKDPEPELVESCPEAEEGIAKKLSTLETQVKDMLQHVKTLTNENTLLKRRVDDLESKLQVQQRNSPGKSAGQPLSDNGSSARGKDGCTDSQVVEILPSTSENVAIKNEPAENERLTAEIPASQDSSDPLELWDLKFGSHNRMTLKNENRYSIMPAYSSDPQEQTTLVKLETKPECLDLATWDIEPISSDGEEVTFTESDYMEYQEEEASGTGDRIEDGRFLLEEFLRLEPAPHIDDDASGPKDSADLEEDVHGTLSEARAQSPRLKKSLLLDAVEKLRDKDAQSLKFLLIRRKAQAGNASPYNLRSREHGTDQVVENPRELCSSIDMRIEKDARRGERRLQESEQSDASEESGVNCAGDDDSGLKLLIIHPEPIANCIRSDTLKCASKEKEYLTTERREDGNGVRSESLKESELSVAGEKTSAFCGMAEQRESSLGNRTSTFEKKCAANFSGALSPRKESSIDKSETLIRDPVLKRSRLSLARGKHVERSVDGTAVDGNTFSGTAEPREQNVEENSATLLQSRRSKTSAFSNSGRNVNKITSMPMVVIPRLQLDASIGSETLTYEKKTVPKVFREFSGRTSPRKESKGERSGRSMQDPQVEKSQVSVAGEKLAERNIGKAAVSEETKAFCGAAEPSEGKCKTRAQDAQSKSSALSVTRGGNIHKITSMPMVVIPRLQLNASIGNKTLSFEGKRVTRLSQESSGKLSPQKTETLRQDAEKLGKTAAGENTSTSRGTAEPREEKSEARNSKKSSTKATKRDKSETLTQDPGSEESALSVAAEKLPERNVGEKILTFSGTVELSEEKSETHVQDPQSNSSALSVTCGRNVRKSTSVPMVVMPRRQLNASIGEKTETLEKKHAANVSPEFSGTVSPRQESQTFTQDPQLKNSRLQERIADDPQELCDTELIADYIRKNTVKCVLRLKECLGGTDAAEPQKDGNWKRSESLMQEPQLEKCHSSVASDKLVERNIVKTTIGNRSSSFCSEVEPTEERSEENSATRVENPQSKTSPLSDTCGSNVYKITSMAVVSHPEPNESLDNNGEGAVNISQELWSTEDGKVSRSHVPDERKKLESNFASVPSSSSKSESTSMPSQREHVAETFAKLSNTANQQEIGHGKETKSEVSDQRKKLESNIASTPNFSSKSTSTSVSSQREHVAETSAELSDTVDQQEIGDEKESKSEVSDKRKKLESNIASTPSSSSESMSTSMPSPRERKAETCISANQQKFIDEKESTTHIQYQQEQFESNTASAPSSSDKSTSTSVPNQREHVAQTSRQIDQQKFLNGKESKTHIPDQQNKLESNIASMPSFSGKSTSTSVPSQREHAAKISRQIGQKFQDARESKTHIPDQQIRFESNITSMPSFSGKSLSTSIPSQRERVTQTSRQIDQQKFQDARESKTHIPDQQKKLESNMPSSSGKSLSTSIPSQRERVTQTSRQIDQQKFQDGKESKILVGDQRETPESNIRQTNTTPKCLPPQPQSSSISKTLSTYRSGEEEHPSPRAAKRKLPSASDRDTKRIKLDVPDPRSKKSALPDSGEKQKEGKACLERHASIISESTLAWQSRLSDPALVQVLKTFQEFCTSTDQLKGDNEKRILHHAAGPQSKKSPPSDAGRDVRKSARLPFLLPHPEPRASGSALKCDSRVQERVSLSPRKLNVQREWDEERSRVHRSDPQPRRSPFLLPQPEPRASNGASTSGSKRLTYVSVTARPLSLWTDSCGKRSGIHGADPQPRRSPFLLPQPEPRAGNGASTSGSKQFTCVSLNPRSPNVQRVGGETRNRVLLPHPEPPVSRNGAAADLRRDEDGERRRNDAQDSREKERSFASTGERRKESTDERRKESTDERRKESTDEIIYDSVRRKTFQILSDLLRYNVNHARRRPYACNICKKTFIDKGALKKHMLGHAWEKAFECGICGMTFSHKKVMQNHKLVHTGKKLQECVVCHELFTSTAALNRHMSVHSEKQQYICRICDRTFSHKQSMMDHVIRHTGEQQHECAICLKKFSRTANLNRHLQIHGVEPYQCNVCDKKLTTSSAMRRHMLTHREELECDVCGKMFERRKSLTKHIVFEHSGLKSREGSVNEEYSLEG